MNRVLARSRIVVVLAAAMLLSLLAIPAIGAPQGASTDAGGGDYLIVELSSSPLAHDDTTKTSGRFDPSSRAYQQALKRLEAEHQRFIDRLAKAAPEAEVVREMFLTANAVTIELNGASLSDVAKVPGVQKTHEPALYQLHMDESLELIGADGGTPGNTAPANAGAGVKVGIIDSGVNPDHPFFACKEVKFGGVFASGVGILPQIPAIPAIFGPGFVPGPGDPLYSSDAHGTHVAGTVGGCVTSIDFLGSTTVSGVAPGAEIWDYNVFPYFGAGMVAFGGSAFSHDIAAAIEKSVADGMDVINMSLGGGVQGPNDFLAQVANAAVDAGVVVVTSAGNSGPDPYTIGSPGSAENVIAVGASTNSRTAKVEVLVPNGGGIDAYEAFPAEWADFDGSPWPLVDWSGSDNLGCTDSGADDHTGELVLIARGTCTFTEKVASAESAGAAGVIIYSDSREPGGMAGEGTIPAVMVSNADGLVLEDRLEIEGFIDGVVVTPQFIDAVTPNLMAGFSSRGPTPFTDIVKPDVVAPGVDILSSVQGPGPILGMFGSAGWELYNGTSMASPHVAGAAAVLLAGNSGLTPAEVKSRFVNTGSILDAYTVWDQGGGLINLPEARNATTTFEPASASFGGWQGNRPVNATVDITMAGAACSVNEVTGGAGATFVDADISGNTLTVSFEGGREAPSGMHGGHVLLTCDGTDYEVPWGVVIDR